MGTGGKVNEPQAYQQLADFARKALGQSAPAQKAFFQQLTEVLQTGGVGARIPIIQRAVEAQSAANAAGMTQTKDQLARSGLAGSPFATNAQLSQDVAGRQQVAGIPTQIASELMGQAPGAIAGAQQRGMTGLATEGVAQLQADEFNALQFKALMEDIKSSIMGSFGGQGVQS